MKRMRKFLMTILAASTILMTGCGNTSVLEEYSFGYTQLKSGNSEVYLMSPMEMGKSQNNDGTVLYGANDSHWWMAAESRPASEITVQQWAEKPISLLEQTHYTDLQTKVSETTVLDRPATEVRCTFNLNVQGHAVQMVGQSLFFEDNGQIWDITYLYNPADPVGKEVVDHVFGQIK